MTNSPELGEEDLRVLRARAQLLDRTKPGVSPGDIVRRVCGVQAQEISSAALALRARAVGLTSDDVHEARVGERSVVRTWAMRGTLQLLASGDVGWLLPLVASRSLPGARRRLAQHGFRDDALAKAVPLLEKMLTEEEPLTRSEVTERLACRGIGTEGQAAYHLIRLAALEGLVCMGPDRGGESTFVLLRDWLGPQSTLEGEAALAELACRYLSAYGPATPEDMAAWSGLRLTETRKAWRLIAGRLSEVDVGTRKMWALHSQDFRLRPEGFVRLLPRYDNYLLGHRSRDFAVDLRYAREVHPGGGLLRPVALVDGRVIAVWGSKRRGAKLTITVRPFDRLDPGVEKELEAETTDLGRFLSMSTGLVIT